MNDLDLLVRTLYSLTTEDRWEKFRADALQKVCAYVDAGAAAWVTHGPAGGAGEFSVFPEGLSVQPMNLLSLPFKGRDDLGVDEAPSAGLKRGLAVRHTHHRGSLTSVITYWFSASAKPPASELLHRISAHMAEAGALALRQYIQRDEWLFAMGRPNRGTAALVDVHGTVYAASTRFRELVSELTDKTDFAALPFELPESAFGTEGQFTKDSLHFRCSKTASGLYLLHARRPLPLDELSPREQQIARALAAGRTFKTVARSLGIAISTVANHASRIYRKLGIYRREELVGLLRKPGQNDPGEG